MKNSNELSNHLHRHLLPYENEVVVKLCFHRLSMGGGGYGIGYMVVVRYPLPLDIRPEDLSPYPSPLDIRPWYLLAACDIWCWSLETCSNLLIWGPNPPSPCEQHLVATETESMCGFQAGSVHPTAMFSCSQCYFLHWHLLIGTPNLSIILSDESFWERMI